MVTVVRRFVRATTASLLLLSVWIGPAFVRAQMAGVLTWHNDNARTGQNLSETILTPANVKPSGFGKLFSFNVDGQVYAQPLYVPNVSIPALGTFNVVYVATEHDTVYAFDADGRRKNPLWRVSFIAPGRGITTISTVSSPCDSLKPEVGVTSTPVIDASTGTLYVVAATSDNGHAAQRLHALDIYTGVEKFGGPALIKGTVSGVNFDPSLIQRTGLLLLNNVVYMSYASLCDPHPYHGWILGYNAQNVRHQVSAFLTTPNGDKGGIWQSGAGLAADTSGHIFVMDGDGTFDANTGGTDYGMSMMRLSTTDGLNVEDYFAPWNQATLSDIDQDLGSGGVLLLPVQSGSHPNEAIGADKEGKIFVVDRDNMGQFDPRKNNIVQTLKTFAGGYFSTPAYWRQVIYYAGVFDSLSAYAVTSGLLSASPISKSTIHFGPAGSTPSISSNGGFAGIVWLILVQTDTSAAVLYAYDATDVSKELYDSNQANGGRDRPGVGVKFSVPTVANGKVYIGTKTELDVYGLLSN